MMNQMRAKKRVHRDTAIGGLASAAVGFAAGGPVGAAAGIIGGALVSSIASSTVNKGRQIYENSKFKNMKVSELKEKNGSGLDRFEMRRAKRYEKIAKKENIKIDPNDPRRDTYEKAVITKRNGWNKENTFTPERQKSMLNTAKTQDKYDLTFLEMVQNTSFENMSKTEFKKKYGRDPKTVRLEAYKEYLKNPEDFIDNRLAKWDNW